ncbi:MAG: hypothetical protein ACREIJ_05820 [Nitrospiraceae bacterium]
MGDGETPSFADAMVLQKAKQMALEEAGTYVESYTKVQNLDLTVEEIQTIAGGVLQVEVLEKKRSLVGDGLQLYAKIRATITTDKMEELARRIKGKNVAEEYKKLQDDYTKLNQDIEMWKQLVAKAPAGPERDKALEQIKGRELAFATIQQREARFIQHFISGELLIAKGLNAQAAIDILFRKVLEGGQEIRVAQTKILPTSKPPNQARIVIDLTVAASKNIARSLGETVSALGGEISEEQSLHVVASYILADRSDLGDIAATLVRATKDMDLARSFQERISNLTLVVELVNGTGPLTQCSLRYYNDPPIPLTDSQADSRTRLIDAIEQSEDTQMRVFYRSGATGAAANALFESWKKELEREDLLKDQLRSMTAQIYSELQAGDQLAAERRDGLIALSVRSGLFMRIVPVQSLLSAGGLFGVGNPSNKLSRRHNGKGFVLIIHDPATFKLEFTLQEDKAKLIDSIRARVIEVDAEQWENMNDRDRCKIMR